VRSGRLLLRVPAALSGRSPARAGRRLVAAGLVVLLVASGPGAPPPVAGTSGDAVVRPVAAGPVTPSAVPAALPQPPGTTSLVSVRRGGGFPNGPSVGTAMSSSGRYVAFASSATDLAAGGTGGLSAAIFLADRRTGKIIRLPLPSGVPADGFATAPSISADGSVVAFAYTGAAAGNFPQAVVMAWDRASGSTSVVSLYSDGFADPSREPAVSGDGRFVAYTSDNSGIVTNDRNRTSDVFRYDRRSGLTDLVSVGFGGNAAGNSAQPSISGDGSIVAFTSSANDVLLPQNNGAGFQVFVRDMNAGVTRLESMAADGTPADGASRLPSISDDGQYLAFDSVATNLLPGLGTAPSQAWRRNLQTGALDLVSMTPSGGPWPLASGRPAISRDGRMVAYLTVGSGQFDNVPNIAAVQRYPTDVYLRDVVAQQTALISVDRNGNAAGVFSFAPSVGGSGRYVAFASSSSALVQGDGNKVIDVFVRDLPPSPRFNPPTIDLGTRAVGSPPTPGAAILNNIGWGPLSVAPATVGGAAASDFPIQGDGCQGRVLYRGDVCTVTVGFSPTGKGSRTATLQVTAVGGGSARTVSLKGRGSQAQIVLDPAIGAQGTVTVARGSGFPPNAQVQLSWSRGITPAMPVVKADAKGSFTIGVLVFHHDITGPRDLVAQSVGGTPFPPLSSSMVVTQRSASPPGFAIPGRIIDVPLVLLLRG
jgi:Tol biopolymer transport system component